MEREKLGSRLGFILLAAGCAIGIGNVWKFPYIAGIGGGGAFVLIYLVFLIILGLPVMIMEFSVGRGAQASPAVAFKKLEPKGTFWHIHGKVGVIGAYILMMFYTSVTAWMVHYFWLTVTGKLTGISAEEISAEFPKILSDTPRMTILVIFVVCVGVLVCARGVQKSLEKITKYMMLALLAIMVILAINSCLMKGANEGLKFYLIPDFKRLVDDGIFKTILAAMNQSFFTLSLGIGSMAIFGSYIGKDRSLPGESVRVIILDTFVALTAGLIIFPACFTYGVDVNAGPPLIFMTLPNIFAHIPLGRLWGSLFFVFMSFAAFSTVFAVFEEIISGCMESFHITRARSSIINLFLLIILALPCVFGVGVMKDLPFFGKIGTDILDLEDFIVSNCLLPLGSLIYCLFCVSRYGWGWDNFIKEANEGKGLKLALWTRKYLTYVLPLIILFLFGYGIWDKFFK